MLKSTFFSKIKKLRREHRRVDTQQEREQLILDLKVILETYRKYASKLDKSGPPGKFEVRCAQLAAYIARTINIIATQYDAVNIKQILEELGERVSKLEQSGEEDKKSKRKSRRPRKKR